MQRRRRQGARRCLMGVGGDAAVSIAANLVRLLGILLVLSQNANIVYQNEAPMALVAFLRGINVGGRRTFRPTVLAKQLRPLGAVNIGAAGTLVVRHPVTLAKLRAELERRLPFDAEIMICQGREIIGLTSQDFFAGHPVRPDIVRFVSVLSRRPSSAPQLPMRLPSHGKWLVKVLAVDGRFVVGLYRRT